MKNLQGAEFAAGDRVRARRQIWRVEQVDPGDLCAVITLSGTGQDNSGRRQRLLVPIDRLEAVATRPRLRRVGARKWQRALRAALLRDDRLGRLTTLQRADVNLLPHQLSPALALLEGDASRLLIADEVGLGKTIQAGIIVAELFARGAAARTLILCPAGLREQWTEELIARFGITATLVDAPQLRHLQRELPSDVNPWQLATVAVSSLDFVKRPEVLALAATVRWDLLIVDEAHHAALASDRHSAVSRLAASAGHVVLLSGTPHNGDAESFATLCALGTAGTVSEDPLRIFRRTRAMVGFAPPRHVRRLAVRQSADERRMHAALARFARAFSVEHDRSRPEVALGLSMLRKRACSSARSLEQSIRRRLLALSSPAAASTTQMPLPWADDDEHEADDEPPAWSLPTLSDAAAERQLLVLVAEAAARAARSESKLAALRRLLRRVHEPILVFTEYRDTLLHVQRLVAPDAAVIHGGLNRGERRAALERFARGGVLLATDAAGEGLNLQRSCRLVINFELPWNPVRLEQRMGRVDRLGQRRTVHAIHLVTRGTAELRVLQRLAERVAQANAAVGIADPLRSGVTGTAGVGAMSDPSASAECDRLRTARWIGPAAMSGAFGADCGPEVWLRRSRHRRLMARTQGRPLVVFQSRVTDGVGRCIGARLVAVLIATTAPAAFDLATLEAVAAALEVRGIPEWQGRRVSAHRAYWDRRLWRERHIDASLDGLMARRPFQPGLFDARERLLEERIRERHTREAAGAALRRDRLVRLAETVVEPLRPILVAGV